MKKIIILGFDLKIFKNKQTEMKPSSSVQIDLL